MKTVRIAIVDDEENERDALRKHLERFAAESGTALDIDGYPSGDVLLQDYRLIYDIIVFDVDMPGTNGLDTARQVREKDGNVTILFVTNIAQYAINAFEVEAADYIIKPVKYYDFALKFRRAVKRAARRSAREIFLETVDGVCRVRTADIAYVKALDHYIAYYVQEAGSGPVKLLVRGKMKDQEAQLKPYNFCRVHKSYLINLTQIKMIYANELTVSDAVIPIGRNYRQKLMEEYRQFVRG